jgi:predicted Rossmann fold flavoprotein
VKLAVDRGVRFLPGTTVTELRPVDHGWILERENGDPLEAGKVIIATGGLSVPKTGSDGTGLAIMERLGHVMHPTYPALTPVTETPPSLAHLAGISLTVTVTAWSEARTATATGGFLFTHRGYSGPAILDVSHVLVRARQEQCPARLSVRWTPHDGRAWDEWLRADGTRTVSSILRQELPDRLVPVLLGQADIPADRTLAQLRREERRDLVRVLIDGELPWNGDEGYRKAEVTGGGVSLGEVDPHTLESRRHRGLFLCGEILDAFGPIGGYNFCWAWATGRAAGRAAAFDRPA